MYVYVYIYLIFKFALRVLNGHADPFVMHAGRFVDWSYVCHSSQVYNEMYQSLRAKERDKERQLKEAAARAKSAAAKAKAAQLLKPNRGRQPVGMRYVSVVASDFFTNCWLPIEAVNWNIRFDYSPLFSNTKQKPQNRRQKSTASKPYCAS